MNLSALFAVAVFAMAILLIFGALYIGAVRANRRGELGFEGIRLLRFVMLGHITIFILLALTAFLT